MKISLELARSLAIETLLRETTLARNDFFPSSLAYRAVKDSGRFLSSLTRLVTRDYRPAASEVVEVPKWDGGTRPAADLPLVDRLLLAALTRHLRGKVADGLVSWSLEGDDRAEAQRALRDGPHGYVMVTDVVSTYEYVNLDILASELLDITGEDEATGTLMDVLAPNSVAGRGIPQGAPGMESLADVYLSIADRALLRQGFTVYRWADDYRIPSDDWLGSIRAQLALERALRQNLGMVINASKTWNPSRGTYADWVGTQQVRERMPDEATQAAIAALFAGTDPYEADEGDVDDQEEPPTGLEDEFRELTTGDMFWGPGPQRYARTNRVRALLRQLGREGSPTPLERLPILLQRYPHLTKDVSTYLRRRLHRGLEDDTLAAISAAAHDHSYLLDWQLGWLLHAAVPASTALPEALVTVAETALGRASAPWFVRGRAAILLARESRLSISEQLLPVLDGAPTATQPDLIAAAALVRNGGAERAGILRASEHDLVLREIPAVVDGLNPYFL